MIVDMFVYMLVYFDPCLAKLGEDALEGVRHFLGRVPDALKQHVFQQLHNLPVSAGQDLSDLGAMNLEETHHRHVWDGSQDLLPEKRREKSRFGVPAPHRYAPR